MNNFKCNCFIDYTLTAIRVTGFSREQKSLEPGHGLTEDETEVVLLQDSELENTSEGFAQ